MRLFNIGIALVIAGFVSAGCAYSTRSGLPAHIRTVEVPTFRNTKTFYKGIEGKLTRRVKELINLDPNLRVVNHGGDALLDGEILRITRTVSRETKQDRPASVVLAIEAVVTFSDEVEQRPLIESMKVSSSQASTVAGLYEVDRGEVRATAEEAAIDALAREIVRRTVGMW